MKLIDVDEIAKPIYAEEDNITGAGMSYGEMDCYNDGIDAAWSKIEFAPTVDAVEVDALEHWLYEIAMNNTDNYLCNACEEIISRLNGLRTFARERKENT